MHDATVDHIRLNTLYIRKDTTNRWSLLIMRKIPRTEKTMHSYTKLVPAIYEYWWRPAAAAAQDHCDNDDDDDDDDRGVMAHRGHVDWKCLGFPPSISGEFFRFGTSLALGVWSVNFMKSWRVNPEKPLKRRCRGTRKPPKRTEDDIDPQDWILDIVYELDEKWFRRNDFISQATALTRWMYGNHLTKYITSTSWPEAPP